jgi:hypothetical protein
MADAPRRYQPGLPGQWQPGTPVAVRNRFTARWSEGFVIAGAEEVSGTRYRLRRASDGALLPEPFAPQDLREA